MKGLAIIRVEKTHSVQQIAQREEHNSRDKDTPNADSGRADWNEEFVNVSGRPVADLVLERIRQAQGEMAVRKGQVLCMEVIMTASPEAFARDDAGRVGDMRGSEWVRDVRQFAQAQWGENLVGLRLHQDEKTPHVHGFVVPINEKSRLSANSVFNPKTLSKLQTDYADAMASHGMERGLRGSRATHKSMQEMYARPAQAAAGLPAPVRAPRLELDKPTLLDRANLGQYLSRQQARVNQALQELADKTAHQHEALGKQVVSLSGEASQAREARKWVAAEREAAQQLRQELQGKDQQLERKDHVIAGFQQQANKDQQTIAQIREGHDEQYNRLLQYAAQGTMPADLLQRGQRLHEQQLEPARQVLASARTLSFRTEAELEQRLATRGYGLGTHGGQPLLVRHGYVDAFRWSELVPGCHSPAQVVQHEQQERAAAQQRATQCLVPLAETGHYLTSAAFGKLAAAQGYVLPVPPAGQLPHVQETASGRHLPLPVLAGEPLLTVVERRARQQQQADLTRIVARVLREEFYTREGFTALLSEAGVTATYPPKGVLLRHPAGQEFTGDDIRPNNQPLLPQYNQAKAANMDRYKREQGRESDGLSR